ncbi:chloride channel [Alternaria rosae]|uniref:chloride channel n=1 Tax=Alternaria rosae TaxID=1187941 RepID=UPI001E8D74DC|nr:chloride channel [Alternaria rosae]KAH6861001.1 chloride channel [Alternaria rosae]
MASDEENGHERTPLLRQTRLSHLQHEQDEEASSIIASTVTKEEQQLAESPVGERLPYNDYTTIDWLHDLVKDSYRYRTLHSHPGLRFKLLTLLDASSGWLAVVVIGALTACIAFLVDVAVVTVSDWKIGYCSGRFLRNRDNCCVAAEKSSLIRLLTKEGVEECADWKVWSNDYKSSFAIYVAMAVAFGVISSSLTMLTRSTLPSTSSSQSTKNASNGHTTSSSSTSPASDAPTPTPAGKVMYLASGSGIPEIKTILSGFSIPSFLSLPVLIVKSLGAIFAVSSSLCLGKEGPFVHVSTCVGHLVGRLIPKYASNGRKMRELLSAACSAGLSVAFGAPIGGVLFSYEEISTYFPRKVLWRAFLCSLTAAMVLKELNPTGTGKLVLFESRFGDEYQVIHYFVFVLLGVAGGIFGGLFCKFNFLWSKWFRAFGVIKKYPVLEVALVVLATALIQYPNPLTREPGDVIIKNLLVDCGDDGSRWSWVCRNERAAMEEGTTNWEYVGWLTYGTLAKLVLTTITFGIKVPSGVIIPALDAGAFFGRLVGQAIGSISPGIFAMVGAAAFLAGVSRMTISLAVIMFELTGQLSYTVPSMLAILTAKWVADAISSEGVYDLAQSLLSHPFLDPDTALSIVRRHKACVAVLIPPQRTMADITVHVPTSNKVTLSLLKEKLDALRERGLMDAGLVLVQKNHGGIEVLQGYISQSELEFGLTKLVPGVLASTQEEDVQVRLLGQEIDEPTSPMSLEMDLTPFVDRTPLSICAKAPLEYAVEMFSKLGLRYLMVTKEGTGQLVGVIIKKRLVGYLEHLREHGEGD